MIDFSSIIDWSVGKFNRDCWVNRLSMALSRCNLVI